MLGSKRTLPRVRVAAFGLLGALLGLAMAPAAHAQDVTVSSGNPTITFYDTDNAANQWLLQGVGSCCGGGAFYLYDSREANIVFQVDSSDSNTYSMHVWPNGDVHFADSAMTIERSSGFVGIGTGSPQGNLHISGGATQDLFSGIGPDLENGPAFNFGYAGFSFGRGSGFFNVRPDAGAVAPNPSLRFATANVQRMIITNIGYVGIGTSSPTNPLQMASGARVTAGGVWTNASSREYKQDIERLTPDEARAALAGLDPVKYAYKADPAERHVGFVAEDVPALVATADRKGLSPMDVVAVLTRVVQEQQRAMQEQQAALAELRAEVAALRQAAGR
jgi:hypothetical protein